MQKLNWLRLGLITTLLFSGFLALQLSSAPAFPKESCCKKSTPACGEKLNTPVEVLTESLSHQFII